MHGSEGGHAEGNKAEGEEQIARWSHSWVVYQETKQETGSGENKV